jgi:putative ABC transport system permease protein
MNHMPMWVGTAVAVALLAIIATAGLLLLRVPRPFAAIGAIARAVAQLSLLSLVLAGILNDPILVAIGLAVMFIAAVGTAARRGAATAREAGALALAMLAGPLLTMTIAFATGAIDFSPRYALAIGGIVIGNTMTIAILTRRVFHTSVIDHWDEVEGWLALGATPRASTIDLARRAVRTALLPSIDQTRTTGIVVLPGAFVGAIFAGASPLEAGRFQVVVLASIIAAGVITASALVLLVGAVRQKPAAVEA